MLSKLYYNITQHNMSQRTVLHIIECTARLPGPGSPGAAAAKENRGGDNQHGRRVRFPILQWNVIIIIIIIIMIIIYIYIYREREREIEREMHIYIYI